MNLCPAELSPWGRQGDLLPHLGLEAALAQQLPAGSCTLCHTPVSQTRLAQAVGCSSKATATSTPRGDISPPHTHALCMAPSQPASNASPSSAEMTWAWKLLQFPKATHVNVVNEADTQQGQITVLLAQGLDHDLPVL